MFLFRLAVWWCSWLHSGWPSWIWGSWSQSEAWWPCCQHGPAEGACGTARRRVGGVVYLAIVNMWGREDGRPTDDDGDEEIGICDM